MDNVLVTGGAGFLGSHVVDCLIDKYNVIVLDDLSGGFKENINPKARFICGSVQDVDLVKKLFKNYHFKNVFHLAAYAAEGLSHFIRNYNYQNNLVGSVNIINNCVNFNVECLVFTSSIAVYGSNQVPMIEQLNPQPEDPYGISKYAVELDLKVARHLFGLNYIIFRPHNIYGERQNIADIYRNVIGIFMNQIMQNKPLTVFGDGTQTRAFTYVKDVAPVIAKSINYPKAFGEVFNIGADTPYSINELISGVAKAMKREPIIDYLPARNEVLHAYASHTKLKEYFPCQQNTPFELGLEKMATWALESGARKGTAFQNIEIERNMPPSWRNLISFNK
jgi:UDP-glucose 4-epimerase